MQIDFLKNKKRPLGKKRTVTLKVTGEELVLIRMKAAHFTDGDLSAWIRYASTYLLPQMDHVNVNSETDPELLELYGESREEGSWRADIIRKELSALARQFKRYENDKL